VGDWLPRLGLRGTAAYRRVDHLLLHQLVFVDCQVRDAGYALDINIIEFSVEVLGLLDTGTGAIGNVKIDIVPDAAGEARMEHRVETDRQLNRNSLLIQPGYDIRQTGCTGGVPNQNDRLDPAAFVLGCGFIGDRCLHHMIADGGRNTLLLQPVCHLVEAE
jgi:hypothetical protein